MALFTEEQLHAIRSIIRRHHTAIIAGVFGPEALSPDEARLLEEAGMLKTKLAAIDDAYNLGHAIGIIDAPKAATMSLDAFRDYLRDNPFELTEAEERAVGASRMMAADHVRNLSAKIERETGRVISEAEQRDAIKEKTTTAIERRKTVGRLKTELGKITKDYDRDWHRVAITELHGARQRGQADHYRDTFGSDGYVFKRAMPDACKYCQELHNDPETGHPIIFKLSALEANGTNVGRKAADWRAVVGTVHPYCQCELVYLPDGWGFNEAGEMVPGGEVGPKIETSDELELSRRARRTLMKAQRTKGRLHFGGMTIAIENPAGSIRYWKTPEGLQGSTIMECAYGYIEGTRGARAEGQDEYDCFVGPTPGSDVVFVVHQQAPPDFDRWDEDKAMLGFTNANTAKAAYLAHYDDDRFFGSMSMMPLSEFREKVMRTGMPVEDGMVKAVPRADPIFDTFVIRPEVEIPEWLGLLLWARELGKGAGHKYVRRVPTGKPKPKYRYFYSITGGRGLGHDEELQVGSAFKVPHGDKEGHFHVTASSGDKVTIRHDESGHETTLSKQALQQLLHKHHAEAIGEKRKKLARDREAVGKHGSEKQKKRIEEEHQRFTARFGGDEKPKDKNLQGDAAGAGKDLRQMAEEQIAAKTKKDGPPTKEDRHTVTKKFPWGKEEVQLWREGRDWHVSWKDEKGKVQEADFRTVSQAARHVFVNTKGQPDEATYKKETGKSPPGVSWNFFGAKVSKKRETMATKKHEGGHNERLQLGELGGLEGLAKLQTFRTEAEARQAAQSIGWAGAHVQPLGSLARTKLPGGVKVGSWVLMEGDRQVVTQDAFSALQDLPKQKRHDPEPPKVERVQKEPVSPDALPKARTKVISQILDASGLDPGTVDTGATAFYEHFSDKHSGHVKDSKVKRILGSGKDPGQIVQELISETIKASGAKTWRDLNEGGIQGGALSVMEHLTEYEELEGLRLPDSVVERHLIEEQMEHYRDQMEAYQEAHGEDRDDDGDLDERDLTDEEAADLSDDAFDFDPSMFRSMTWASTLRVVKGSRKALWRDGVGRVWVQLTAEAGERLVKSDQHIIEVPTYRRGELTTRYFQPAGLRKSGSGYHKQVFIISQMGNRAVDTGPRGQAIQNKRLNPEHDFTENRKPPAKAGFDPLTEWREKYLNDFFYRKYPKALSREKLELNVGLNQAPITAEQYVQAYDNIVNPEVTRANRERVDREVARKAGRTAGGEVRRAAPIKKGEVTIRKRGLGHVTLRYGSSSFVVEVPDKGEASFPSLSSACDHVWCLQKGYSGAEEYKAKTGKNKVPSGAGWKFWGVRAA
jgi:hypothetical protein